MWRCATLKKWLLLSSILLIVVKMDLRKRLMPLSEGSETFELNLSVDCVIFTIQKGALKVLLTKLAPELMWMLPGGFMTRNENANQAASRILQFRTGVDNVYLNQFQIFSELDRFSFETIVRELPLSDQELAHFSDLPQRVISIGYFALVNFESIHLSGGDLKEESYWCDVHQLPSLEFDHKHIIQEALIALRKEVYFKPIVYRLLPEKFTLPELQKLYEVILDKKLDRGSFQRKMLRWDIFERLEERRNGVPHKRPYLYRFSDQKYHLAIEQGTNFGM